MLAHGVSRGIGMRKRRALGEGDRYSVHVSSVAPSRGFLMGMPTHGLRRGLISGVPSGLNSEISNVFGQLSLKPKLYTLIVTRWPVLLIFLLMTVVWAQEQEPAKPAPPPPKRPTNVLQEEDETLKTKEYSFNPLQAQKELEIGNYYFKKKSYKAAAGRFLEATKWDKNLADAYLHLGETDEKLKDQQAACEAYRKYLQLDPNSKLAPAIKKKVEACKAR